MTGCLAAAIPPSTYCSGGRRRPEGLIRMTNQIHSGAVPGIAMPCNPGAYLSTASTCISTSPTRATSQSNNPPPQTAQHATSDAKSHRLSASTVSQCALRRSPSPLTTAHAHRIM